VIDYPSDRFFKVDLDVAEGLPGGVDDLGIRKKYLPGLGVQQADLDHIILRDGAN